MVLQLRVTRLFSKSLFLALLLGIWVWVRALRGWVRMGAGLCGTLCCRGTSMFFCQNIVVVLLLLVLKYSSSGGITGRAGMDVSIVGGVKFGDMFTGGNVFIGLMPTRSGSCSLRMDVAGCVSALSCCLGDGAGRRSMPGVLFNASCMFFLANSSDCECVALSCLSGQFGGVVARGCAADESISSSVSKTVFFGRKCCC